MAGAHSVQRKGGKKNRKWGRNDRPRTGLKGWMRLNASRVYSPALHAYVSEPIERFERRMVYSQPATARAAER